MLQGGNNEKGMGWGFKHLKALYVLVLYLL
jgi:hypothetical protein